MTIPLQRREAIIEEAERLLKDITPGEWQADRSGIDDGAYHPAIVYSKRPHAHGRPEILYVATLKDFYGNEDAEFIAASPRLVRDLLALLETPQEQPEPK